MIIYTQLPKIDKYVSSDGDLPTCKLSDKIIEVYQIKTNMRNIKVDENAQDPNDRNSIGPKTVINKVFHSRVRK